MEYAAPNSINSINGCLVVSLSADWDPTTLAGLQRSTLAQLKDHPRKRLILDFSGLDSVDSRFMQGIGKLIQMAALMGAAILVSGFKPGVAASMAALGLTLTNVHCTGNLDSALAMFADDRTAPTG